MVACKRPKNYIVSLEMAEKGWLVAGKWPVIANLASKGGFTWKGPFSGGVGKVWKGALPLFGEEKEGFSVVRLWQQWLVFFGEERGGEERGGDGSRIWL